MKRRTRWLLGLAVPMLAIVLLLAGGWSLLRQAPAWYQPDALSPAQAAAAANRADQKILDAVSWATEVQGEALRIEHSAAGVGDEPVSGNKTITFTEEEINAFLRKWSQWHGLKARYEAWVQDPAVVLEDDRIIFAGLVRDLNTVASLHLEPRIDGHGRLLLDMKRILGGRLPLPQALFSNHKQRAIDALSERLPGWKGTARIDGSGSGNDSAVAAVAAKLALDVLHQVPAEAVIFLPADELHNVPVRLSDVRVKDKTLTLTVTALEPEQREALLERLVTPQDFPTARSE